MTSLRARLLGVWSLSLLACVAVGVLLLQLSRQSTQARTGRAEAILARACDLIDDKVRFYATGWSGPGPGQYDDRLRHDLTALVDVALAGQDGIEGGIWQADAGPLAYAYPTYEGAGPKTDLPAAERDRIAEINLQAAQDERPVDRDFASGGQSLLLRACPLAGPIPNLTAWTMTRVRAVRGLGPLALGLGVLLALMAALAAWLGRIALVWGRHVGNIRAALGAAGAAGMPVFERTGERELDQVVDALNEAGRRLVAARREADEMTARAMAAEHLAGLGRVAAGVAHEIRNPLAAARLQGENALAGDDSRRRAAIADMLDQLARLDGLVTELLAMTQRATPDPRRVAPRDVLARALDTIRDEADRKSVALTVRAEGTAWLDPTLVGRVMDNLLANAVRHVPAGGSVAVAAERTPGRLTITVADTGPGVAPNIAPRLFEPFVTGRPDGTGLGLAIARELADAHGGRLTLARNDSGGATFALELPSPDDDHCQPS